MTWFRYSKTSTLSDIIGNLMEFKQRKWLYHLAWVQKMHTKDHVQTAPLNEQCDQCRYCLSRTVCQKT